MKWIFLALGINCVLLNIYSMETMTCTQVVQEERITINDDLLTERFSNAGAVFPYKTALTYDLSNASGHVCLKYKGHTDKVEYIARVEWIKTLWKPSWYGNRLKPCPIASLTKIDNNNPKITAALITQIEEVMLKEFPNQSIELIWDGDSYDKQNGNVRSFLISCGFANRGCILSKELTTKPDTGHSPR